MTYLWAIITVIWKILYIIKHFSIFLYLFTTTVHLSVLQTIHEMFM